jgi:hypothetical protein
MLRAILAYLASVTCMSFAVELVQPWLLHFCVAIYRVISAPIGQIMHQGNEAILAVCQT